MKLKVGDRVEVIENEDLYLEKGEIGIVAGIYGLHISFQSENPSCGAGNWIIEKYKVKLVEKKMNRQEALIEIIKGNKVKNIFGDIMWAKNLEAGRLIFMYKSGNTGVISEGVGSALDNECGPFTLVPPTKKITLDGKDIEISEESFNELKKQLVGE